MLEDKWKPKDPIIDFYTRYLLHTIFKDLKNKVHVFPCSFYTLLSSKIVETQDEYGKLIPQAQQGYHKARRTANHVDIFSKDFLAIPINKDDSHWYLVLFAIHVYWLDLKLVINPQFIDSRSFLAYLKSPSNWFCVEKAVADSCTHNIQCRVDGFYHLAIGRNPKNDAGGLLDGDDDDTDEEENSEEEGKIICIPLLGIIEICFICLFCVLIGAAADDEQVRVINVSITI